MTSVNSSGPDVDFVVDLLRGALEVAGAIAGPLLLAILMVGVVVSVIQVVTQIQEQTLTFVPKLAAVSVILLLGGGWMLTRLTDWVTELWSEIPSLVG